MSQVNKQWLLKVGRIVKLVSVLKQARLERQCDFRSVFRFICQA